MRSEKYNSSILDFLNKTCTLRVKLNTLLYN